jgi:hypothetical protein
LIDEIYEEIHAKTPCDFENGLAGIGWGIEYLIRNKFIDADPNEVLEEFDSQIIHEISSHAPDDIGILNGVSSYILYFLSRLNSNEAGTALFESICKTLMDLFDLLKKRITTKLIGSSAEVLWNEPDKFDLAWDYPSVIWVLSELIHIRVCAEQARELINKLVSPVLDEGKLPKLNSHQLLFALALQKLTFSFPKNALGFNLETFLTGIEHEAIAKELADNSAFLQDGTSGIAFIYQQLFELTNNPSLKVQSKNWMVLVSEFPLYKQDKPEFSINNKGNSNKAYGILNGLAGINLFTYEKS